MIAPIPGFAGYFADDRGFILSGLRSGRKPKGVVGPVLSGKLVRLKETSSGRYLQVALCRDGKAFTKYVHRLVLEAFVGPCPEGMECLHGNGVHHDCSLGNLRWGTSLENSADTVAHGRQTSGELIPQSKLKTPDIAKVFGLRRQGYFQREIADRLGVSRSVISLVLSGKRWKHVSRPLA